MGARVWQRRIPTILVFPMILFNSISAAAAADPSWAAICPYTNSIPNSNTNTNPFALLSTRTTFRILKPLLGEDDGRVYLCSDRNFVAFENNGSIAWTVHLDYSCNSSVTPVHGGRGKIFVIAENRVVSINFSNLRTSPPTSEVFFEPEKGEDVAGDIIGIAVGVLSSSVFINIKKRGLFAYTMRGELVWSCGTVVSQFGYRIGCKFGTDDCYFASAPIIDRCEGSIYISNSAGELYSLSLRSPHFNWVQDLSSFDKDFIITSGNNGLLYVTLPSKAIVLALGASMGNLLWQTNVGPLSLVDCKPIVDTNGWISIGSLDGFLYSISPSGDAKRFSKAYELESVIQVSPILDCSGDTVYVSQAQMEGKSSNLFGEYNYISSLRPKGVVFTLIVPSTGAVYWSESYPGKFSSLLSQSDLQYFAFDEGVLLAFIAASRKDNPLPCRSKNQQLVSTCSLARPKHAKIYTGNERTIMLFLIFESISLVVFAGLVRFCCIFWRKKKLQAQSLGYFLEKRRYLQRKKKEFDRTITELQRKATEEATGNEVIEELGDLVRERKGIEKKLSTTYSLGRDENNQQSTPSLPLHDAKIRSYSFQSTKKESVTIFHALTDSSSSLSSPGEESIMSDRDSSSWEVEEEENKNSNTKAKGLAKATAEEVESSATSAKVLVNSLSIESVMPRRGERSSWLQRRRTLSSTN